METLIKSILAAVLFYIAIWIGELYGLEGTSLILLGLSLIYIAIVTDKL